MIAVKEKIKNVQEEIEEWKKENTDIVSRDEELLPETYIKLRYPDDELAQKNAIQVLVN